MRLLILDNLSVLSGRINTLLNQNKKIIVGIDGRCASGKTTLASDIKNMTGCSVIHADDFFLRPDQRTPERYEEPGGNIDYERMQKEVFENLKKNVDFSYRPFDCRTLGFKEPVKVCVHPLTVVEGTYSCHPMFERLYDIRIFCDVSAQTQLERIRMRNGVAALENFKNIWIPLEEKYFRSFEIKEHSDYIFTCNF